MDSPAEEPSPVARWGRRLLVAVLIVLVVVVIYYVAHRLIVGPDRFTIESTRPVVSRVDGREYRVHQDLSSSQRAADMLASLNGRIVDLMRHLRARYMRGADGERHPARRAAVERLLARYNPDNLTENSPKDPTGETAYSQDKGSLVALCLRERGTRTHDLHDLETLTFVTFHEMSHIAIDAIDHPDEFWNTFRFLLEAAEEGGIYRSEDFARTPRMYCGVPIDWNPRYAENTVSI